MDKKLRETIEKVKSELSKDASSVIIGKVNDGLSPMTNKITIQPYHDFLEICNGARCGMIDLWSYADIEKNQYRVTELAGGSEKWICIGQILYEPLVLNLEDETISLFYQGCENEIQGQCFGKLDKFLMDYAFEAQYNTLIPDTASDAWYLLRKNLNCF